MKNVEKWIIVILSVIAVAAIGTAVYFGINVYKDYSNKVDNKKEELHGGEQEILNTYTSVAGKYVNLGDSNSYIIFKEDGTFEGQYNDCEGYGWFESKYEIKGEDIILLPKSDDLSSIFHIMAEDLLLEEPTNEFTGGFTGCSSQQYYKKQNIE